MEEKTKSSKINIYLILLLPSILALAISITAIMYQFGQKVFDLNNTCYYIFVSANTDSDVEPQDKEVFETIGIILRDFGVEGFTIVKNDLGGYVRKDGSIATETSYQVILMDISHKKAYTIAEKIRQCMNQEAVLVEEAVISKSYVKDGIKYKKMKDVYSE